MYHAIFLTNVRRLLDERQLTKQALAEKAGISVSFLSDLTNGKANPSLKIMGAIAQALEVPLPVLLQAQEADAAAQDATPGHWVPRKLPPGMARVAAVLTDYQAYHVRQWDAVNRQALARGKRRTS